MPIDVSFSDGCSDPESWPQVEHGNLTVNAKVPNELTLACFAGYRVKGKVPRRCVEETSITVKLKKRLRHCICESEGSRIYSVLEL